MLARGLGADDFRRARPRGRSCAQVLTGEAAAANEHAARTRRRRPRRGEEKHLMDACQRERSDSTAAARRSTDSERPTEGSYHPCAAPAFWEKDGHGRTLFRLRGAAGARRGPGGGHRDRHARAVCLSPTNFPEFRTQGGRKMESRREEGRWLACLRTRLPSSHIMQSPQPYEAEAGSATSSWGVRFRRGEKREGAFAGAAGEADAAGP